MKKLSKLLLLFLAIVSCTEPNNDIPMKTVESKLQSQISDNNTPGLQYYFFDKDSIIFSFEGGFADIKDQRKVTANTTFNCNSVTKTFTALAVLQLAEQGKISLDDPISKYLFDFPYPKNITVRQLLSHSAGIPNPIPIRWIHSPEEHASFDSKAFFDDIFKKHNKVESNPNEKFSYSNLGYVFLGMLVEEVSGQDYSDYVDKNIIRRIGITPEELGFTIQNPELQSKGYQKTWSFMNLALSFMFDKSKYIIDTEGKFTSYNSLYVNGSSYGGLIGSGTAFVSYLQELMKQENRLISDDFRSQLFTENILNSGKPSGMCLSWFKGELNGHTYYSHAGGGGFFYCEIRMYPELGKGSVVMFNRTGVSDERILDDFDRYLIQ